MDKNAVYPEKTVITIAKEHDTNQLEVLVDDKESMYVFDRAYVNYEHYDRMTDDDYLFVSRLKKNAVIREVYSFPLPNDGAVLSDKMGYLRRTKNLFRILKLWTQKEISFG